MCGILFSNDLTISLDNFRRALSLMKHRGPDYSKCSIINKFKLGHNRLAIQDLKKRSNQPFKIGNYHIIFNGEIYNFKDLKSQENFITRTSSDTEILLLLYIKYGKDCLKKLNGMFSFIIFNEKTKKFFVARDRLGIKPLYYWIDKKNFIFSSEIAPILYLKNNSLYQMGLRQYKKLRMCLGQQTLYKNIKMFPAGSYMTENKFINSYWKLDLSKKKNPSLDHVKFLIEDSVKIRNISDVPVGTFLSGGLDSTIITNLTKPKYSWTIGFKELNEFNWSDLANRNIKSIHKKLMIDNVEFLKTAKKIIQIRKEPLCVPNEVMIYKMSKKMKKYNTVVLSGEGADELFFGYDRIFKFYKSRKIISIKDFDRLYCYGSNNDEELISDVISKLPGKKAIDKITYFMQIHHLHGLLRRLDNSTMLASVEGRVPFVDHRLVDLITGTSFSWKINLQSKMPLRKIFNTIIPKKIILREKIGFPTPLNNIFKTKNNPYDYWLKFNLNNLK